MDQEKKETLNMQNVSNGETAKRPGRPAMEIPADSHMNFRLSKAEKAFVMDNGGSDFLRMMIRAKMQENI